MGTYRCDDTWDEELAEPQQDWTPVCDELDIDDILGIEGDDEQVADELEIPNTEEE